MKKLVDRILRKKHKMAPQLQYTPDQLAAARLASRRGIVLRGAQAPRLPEKYRIMARVSLRQALARQKQ